MFAITDNTGDPVSQRILKDRKYTFVVDDDAGELQAQILKKEKRYLKRKYTCVVDDNAG
jgi:hypothetical protein